MLGARDFALAAAEMPLYVIDVPGRWYDTTPTAATGNSLAIVAPGTTIKFKQNNGNGTFLAESRHTVTSLLWPSTAPTDDPNQLIGQVAAN